MSSPRNSTVLERSTSPLIIRLFGPFEVSVDGVPLARLRSMKGQWLLSLLVLRAGQDLSRAWLAGMLWPDCSEPRALANLRTSLNDLRQALTTEACRLGAPTTRTLRLELSGVETDVVAFDGAVARGDPTSLARAVGLYRGPLLEGCGEEWVYPERRAREAAYLGARETLAVRALADGDLADAEQHLRALLNADPLRESAQRSLMQVLAAGGNYAAALESYRELRLLLHRELNAEPDPETQALFQQIRSDARTRAQALSPEPTILASSTRHPAAEKSPLPVLPPESPADLSPLQGRGAGSHTLTVPRTPLIGRETEVAAVRQLLRRHDVGLVTLTGPGGSGKTRLALQVAADLRDDFEAGVFFVDLSPLRDPALVPSAIAQALGVRERSGQPLLEALKSDLREKQTLLVLDNYEHLLAAVTVVAELLASCSHVKVLATSREFLRLRGEHEHLVPPLALPDRQRLPPADRLSQYAAVELFIQRARAAKLGFSVTTETAPAIAEICCRLDGLPLAIELAAARVRLLSPLALLSRLESRLKLLTGGARDLPVRQQALQDTIAWSHDLLDADEKRLFRQASVFVGGFTLAAAEAFHDPHGRPAIPVFDGLASLVEKNLMRCSDIGGHEPRFSMLETVGEFAARCLSISGEEEAVRRQHAAFFLSLAEEVQPHLWGADQREWMTRLEVEHDNLRAALTWAAEGGDVTIGLRLGSALASFWDSQGYHTEGLERLTTLLARAGTQAPATVRARAFNAAGSFAQIRGEYRSSRAMHEEAMAICRESDDRFGTADTLLNLGMVEQNLGDYGTAWPLLEESLAIFTELERRDNIAVVLGALGINAFKRIDYPAAEALHGAALALRSELGNHYLIALSLNNLGLLAHERGDFTTARGFHRESLAILRDLGEKSVVLDVLEALAGTAGAQGESEQAARLFGATAAHREAIQCPTPSIWRDSYDRNLRALHAALGEEGFTAAWTAGRAISIEEATLLALEASGDGLPTTR